MNRPQLLAKTRQILFDAYYNDTLEHGNCHACTVGNMVAANMGIKIVPVKEFCMCTFRWEKDFPLWDSVFCTGRGIQRKNPLVYNSETPRAQIDATGYTWEELAKIEFAFETAHRGDSDEDYMYNGLVAVLDVLDQIHDVATHSESLNRRLCQKQ